MTVLAIRRETPFDAAPREALLDEVMGEAPLADGAAGSQPHRKSALLAPRAA